MGQSALSKLAGIAVDTIPGVNVVNAVANKASGGKIGFDPTPGFGATNFASKAITSGINAPGPNYGSPTGGRTGTTAAGDAGSGAYTGGSSPSGGGSGGALSVDPQAAAYYNNLANDANNSLGRLDNQLNIGNQNISNAYQHSLDSLNGQKDLTTRDYNTQKDQTLADNVHAKGGIDFGVYSQNNALQKLLGAHGYTGSANQAAGYAAALQGSQQRNQVQGAFNRNQQALDTNFGDYMNGFNNSVGDLGTQKHQQEQSLQQSIAQNKQSLLSQLAAITQQRATAQGKTLSAAQADAQPFANQVNALSGQIDQLGLNPSFNANAPVYKAPTLDAYNYDKAAAPTVGGQPGFADTVNPYLSVLLGQQKKQQANPLIQG